MALRSKAGEERASSHTRERPRLEPGALVDGRYQIVGALGEGGIGTVLVAEHVELRRRVALKVLQDPIGDDPTMRKRFEREARTLAAMQHPHIVAIIDYGIWSGMPYLVMELLEGRTLGDLLHEEGSLPQARALAIAHQMLRALGYAHSQGVIHRDLKPANVFLQALPDQQDHVKLLDFGFAKFFGSAVSSMVTGDGMVVGTPSYMAPEQATSGPLDQRVDVYAAGTVIFEMLAGRRPFEGQGLEVIRHRLVADPPALSAVRPDLGVSPELDEALSRALARKVEDRWPAIAELMAALARVPESAKVIVPIHSEPPAGVESIASLLEPAAAIGSIASLLEPAPLEPALLEPAPLEPAPESLALSIRSGDLEPLSGAGEGISRPDRTAVEAALRAIDAARSRAAEPPPSRELTIELASEELELAADTRAAAPEPAPRRSLVWLLTLLAIGAIVAGVVTWQAWLRPPIVPSVSTPPPTRAAPEPTHAEPVLVDPVPATSEPAPAEPAPIAPALEEPAPEAPAPDEPAPAPSEVAAPSDPWSHDVPLELSMLKRRIHGAQAPSEADVRSVAGYARRHPEDARAILLMAHGYVRTGWPTGALQQYRAAYALDPSVLGDPTMLADLVAMASSPSLGATAAELLASTYGERALPAIDAALEGSRGIGAERLRGARQRIAP